MAGTHPHLVEQWPGNVIPNRGCSEYRVGDVFPFGSEGNVEAHRSETRAYEIRHFMFQSSKRKKREALRSEIRVFDIHFTLFQ